MAIRLFLGRPPQHIEQWIKEHSKPQLTELCFTAEEANSSVSFRKYGPAALPITGFNGLEYKFNNGDWTSYTIGSTISLSNIGDKVYMRAVPKGNLQLAHAYNVYYYFVMTGKIAASGNVNTLLNPDPNAEVSLEGTRYCYNSMFSNCSSLTQAPELPATTLASNCYYYMFRGCTSLTQAPKLPATTLADYCYSHMFYDCTNVNSVDMKKSVEGIYDNGKHGTLKDGIAINYVLD